MKPTPPTTTDAPPRAPTKRPEGAPLRNRNASAFTEPTVRVHLRLPMSANAILLRQCAISGQTPSAMFATYLHSLEAGRATLNHPPAKS